MKSFLKYFFAQSGVRGFLLLAVVAVPIWSIYWSKQDGRFNYSVIVGATIFFLFVMLCTWIAQKIKNR